MSDDEPSSPESSFFCMNGYEDVDEENVNLNFEKTSSFDLDSSAPPKKKKRGKRALDESSLVSDTEEIPDTPSLPDTPSQTTSAPVDSILIPDSPEPETPVGRRGRSLRRCRQQALGRNLPQRNAVSTHNVIVVDDIPSPHPLEELSTSNFSFSDSINLSSDDESSAIGSTIQTEDINKEIFVRVSWRSQGTHKIKMRKFQKMKEVFSYFSELEKVPEDRIYLTLDEKKISPFDTPDSLNIGFSFLDGGLISVEDVQSIEVRSAPAQQADPNALQFTVQQKGVKEKLTVSIGPKDTMAVLISKLAEDLQIPTARLKVTFDGDILEPNDTPDSLDLEGGECFDLVIKD